MRAMIGAAIIVTGLTGQAQAHVPAHCSDEAQAMLTMFEGAGLVLKGVEEGAMPRAGTLNVLERVMASVAAFTECVGGR